MLAEVITIGDELCRGEIVDTNRSWLAGELWDLDVTVAWMTSCRDDAADIRRAIGEATARADVVLVSGGLGPTEDDLTLDVVASMAGVGAVVHEPSAERLRTRFAGSGRSLDGTILRQVRAPEGARVYGNAAGLAPGFEIELHGAVLICLPGPPRELQAIFRDHLAPRLIELREAAGEEVERIARRIYRVFGLGESTIADALDGLALGPGASLHYQVKFPETLVKVVVRDRDAARARGALERIEADLRARLGRALYGADDDSLAASVGRALAARGATLATAESCTGGLLGALVTEVPGSSAYYLGGAVCYANAEKERQLGVRAATLAEHGAVSEACVREMAAGIRARTGASVGVAVSGVAGPTGGTEDKPVGTVWIAVDGPGEASRARRYQWPGARDQVRLLAAAWALAMVARALEPEGEA